jgi:hypothetical protein
MLPALLVSSVPILLISLAFGSLLDTDTLAHRLWARQLVASGSLSIAENGVFNDVTVYYPNTVLKPLPLAVAVIDELAGGSLLEVLAPLTGILVILLAGLAVLRISGEDWPAACLAMALLGFSPIFVAAAIHGNPSILLLGLLFALSTGKTRWHMPVVIALPLVRPEGLIYSVWYLIHEKRYRLMILLILPVAVWPILNRLTAGYWLWSMDAVRYVVSAMSYPTPGVATFWPWALLRGLLTIGPVLSAVMLLQKQRKWRWGGAVLLNLILLWLSLAGGSLVLPRYLDHIFLLMVPWAVTGLAALAGGNRLIRRIVFAGALAGVLVPWPGFLRESAFHAALRTELAVQADRGWGGRLAVNELLVPAIALQAGIPDASSRFLALDRAAWEHIDEDSLLTLGVDRVLIVDHPLYLPQHTKEYLMTLEHIRIDTLMTGAE